MKILNNLKPSERFLAFVLLGIAVLLLNLLMLPQLLAANREGKTKGAELTAKLGAAEGWMSKKDFWAEREKWLLENQPVIAEGRTDSLNQLERLQRTAKSSDLTISDIRLLQLTETAFYTPVGAKFTVNGPWSGMVSFLETLQTPTRFKVVTRFTIKSAEEPAKIQCEMEIQRWFQRSNSSSK